VNSNRQKHESTKKKKKNYDGISYRCALIYEYGIAMCRVTTRVEVPTIKEVAPLLYPQMASVSCVYSKTEERKILKKAYMSLS
jgi:hypothetical protein